MAAMSALSVSYKRHRFPRELIAHGCVPRRGVGADLAAEAAIAGL